jgi:hypothetical protein
MSLHGKDRGCAMHPSITASPIARKPVVSLHGQDSPAERILLVHKAKEVMSVKADVVDSRVSWLEAWQAT